MRRYSLFSNKLQSDITFKYGANGVLIGFEFADDKELTTAQLEEFVNNLPWSYQTLKAHCAKWKLKLTELVPDLSFTAFWNRYNYKDGGSKKKAEAAWNRMPESKRAKAMAFIPKYEERLRTQRVAKMYATTYLNSEIFED